MPPVVAGSVGCGGTVTVSVGCGGVVVAEGVSAAASAGGVTGGRGAAVTGVTAGGLCGTAFATLASGFADGCG